MDQRRSFLKTASRCGLPQSWLFDREDGRVVSKDKFVEIN